MPITHMWMRRICEGSRCINLVPKGLYGDVSGDINMWQLEDPDVDNLSLFIYEEIAAFKEAVTKKDRAEMM